MEVQMDTVSEHDNDMDNSRFEKVTVLLSIICE